MLDIGADHGQSIDAMRLLLPDLDVRPYGLSEAEQRTTVYVPHYNGLSFDGLATIDRESAAVWLRHSIYCYDPAKFELRPYTCDFLRLDDLALRPATFVKIDVQGSEEAVLRGALDSVDRHSPVLLVENNDDNVPAILHGMGYHRYTWDLADERLVPFAGHVALGSIYARVQL